MVCLCNQNPYFNLNSFIFLLSACEIYFTKMYTLRAVVIAKLVDQSLPTSEARGSNPVTVKFIYTVKRIEKMKIKGIKWNGSIFLQTKILLFSFVEYQSVQRDGLKGRYHLRSTPGSILSESKSFLVYCC